MTDHLTDEQVAAHKAAIAHQTTYRAATSHAPWPESKPGDLAVAHPPGSCDEYPVVMGRDGEWHRAS